MKYISVAFVLSLAAAGHRYYNNGANEVVVVVDKEMSRLEKRNMAAASSFQIKSTVNTSGGQELCLHINSLSDGEVVKVKDCIESEEKQQWKTDADSRILADADPTLCKYD